MPKWKELKRFCDLQRFWRNTYQDVERNLKKAATSITRIF